MPYKFAKEHWQEKHSVTTMRELSLVLKQPQLFENYLKTLPFNQNGTLTWEQAQEIAQNAPRKMVSFKPVAAGKAFAREFQTSDAAGKNKCGQSARTG